MPSIRAKSSYVDVKGVLEILNSLYPNKAFALVWENLQNSIDAGARSIWIAFDPTSRKATFIEDGTGIPIARMNERDPGFRLIPKDFNLDEDLRPHSPEMTWRTGPVIFVNLGHPSCPANRLARSLYIWCCGFAEIVRAGGLSHTDELTRDRLLMSYKGWLQSWKPDLVRFTAGVD